MPVDIPKAPSSPPSRPASNRANDQPCGSANFSPKSCTRKRADDSQDSAYRPGSWFDPHPYIESTNLTNRLLSLAAKHPAFSCQYDGQWIIFAAREAALPAVGWKIHVSISARELENNGPTLIDQILSTRLACLKVAGTYQFARRVNSGIPDRPQVGKIITVYPASGEDLQELIDRCLAVAPNNKGPALQTDLWLERGGRVGLRFGAFCRERILDYVGRIKPAIRTPAGKLVEDTRALDGKQHSFSASLPAITSYTRPAVHIASGIQCGGSHWHPLALLHSSAKGEVALAARRSAPFDFAIIKTALPGISCTTDDQDSKCLLMNERRILDQLSKYSFPCPSVIAYETGSDRDILAMEDIGGDPFSFLPPKKQLARLAEVLSIVQSLHDLGFVHRDLKADNLISAGNKLFLIDFELASLCDDTAAYRAYTPGYASPQDLSCSKKSRDYYSLAYLIAQNLCEAPASTLPINIQDLKTLLEMVSQSPYVVIVERLLDACNMGVNLNLNSLISGAELDDRKRPRNLDRSLIAPARQRLWRRKVMEDASFITRAEACRDSSGVYWKNHRPGEDWISTNLANGTAGTTLALVVFDYVNNNENHAAIICDAGFWLCKRPVTSSSGGLFTGYAGMALVLALLHKRYNCNEFLEASHRFSESMKHGAIFDPDFYFGGAGMLYAASSISLILKDKSFLSYVSPVANFLTSTVLDQDGLFCWESSHIVSDRRNPCLGLAHGAIGTALALAVYGRASGSEDASRLARKTLLSVFHRGRDIHGDQIRIALDEDQCPDPPHYWCRGLGGLLWASLQVFSPKDNEASTMISWLANKILASRAFGNISYCHGLSGRLELLRMLASWSPHAKAAEQSALDCEHFLRHFSVLKDGRLTWHTEDIGQFSNELWLGGLAGATALALRSIDYSAALISPEFFITAGERMSSTTPEVV